ncbi:hypothetical protein CJP74_03980 [Psittacicella melopsittaci]|uniref:Uncharacterized protein n=1 Tax=Psittacicella melopsittaci TaxID=2028576 RepID=A0A3A1Y5B6_9GAMM|nr:hypothetical protein [Psittacicella melopsittaci]RIY32651.1 hypothetical protein CJP74_03980 [Psittacicella melopsittaci]
MQTNTKPFFRTSALLFVVAVVSLILWSNSFQSFSGQSWNLFFVAVANVEYSTLWRVVFLGVMLGFIPLAISVCALYFRRKTLKPRFFFALINLILLALTGWLIFTLTQSSDAVFAGQGELKQYFYSGYALVSLLGFAWTAFYLAPLYSQTSITGKPLLKYIGIGILGSAASVALALGVLQELNLSLYNAPGLRYTVSLYGYAGAMAGVIYFLIALALIKFMQASTAYEEKVEQGLIK